MFEQFKKSMVEDIPTHILSTDKYKTNFITFYIRQPLEEASHTHVALLPSLLKRGTVNFPSSQRLKEALDELYGASLTVDVAKRGEEQVASFRLQLPNEKFLSDSTPLFEKGIQLLAEVILNPLLENGIFKQTNVDLEIDLLRRRLSQLKDDKIRYANKRCVEEMFKNERYRLYTYGSEEQLNAITAQSLYDHYTRMIQTHPIDLFVVGDLDEAYVQDVVRKHLRLPRQSVIEIPETSVDYQVEAEQVVTEHTKIAQGKLHIGCRTHTTFTDLDYIPLIVFNGVFGGFPHSKLFRNVREKESLAYYVSSSIESHKGFMMLMSGIDTNNYDKTVDIIKQELQNCVEGQITEEEIVQTKAMLSNQIRETNDQPFLMMERALNGIIGKKERTSEETIDGITEVTKEDIQRVAQKVDIDTIYFLTSDVDQASNSVGENGGNKEEGTQ